MFSKIKQLFCKNESYTVNQNNIKNQIKSLKTKLTILKNQSDKLIHTKSIVIRIVDTSRLLLDSGLNENITFIQTYLPHIKKLVESQINYKNLNNDLRTFFNTIESKKILIRLANALEERYKYLVDKKIDDFTADISTLDSILKMRGH